MSNKIPKEDSAKIESERKHLLALLLLAGVILLVALGSLSWLQLGNKNDVSKPCVGDARLEKLTVRNNSTALTAEIARTAADRYQGLSGRNCLDVNQAMLFVFDIPDDYCFVMRDMQFAIDIIWLDEDKRIVTIKNNATPNSYPSESFCPTTPAQYVLEVGKGLAESLQWQNGEQFVF
jgi:hypothetical protein